MSVVSERHERFTERHAMCKSVAAALKDAEKSVRRSVGEWRAAVMTTVTVCQAYAMLSRSAGECLPTPGCAAAPLQNAAHVLESELHSLSDGAAHTALSESVCKGAAERIRGARVAVEKVRTCGDGVVRKYKSLRAEEKTVGKKVRKYAAKGWPLLLSKRYTAQVNDRDSAAAAYRTQMAAFDAKYEEVVSQHLCAAGCALDGFLDASVTYMCLYVAGAGSLAPRGSAAVRAMLERGYAVGAQMGVPPELRVGSVCRDRSPAVRAAHNFTGLASAWRAAASAGAAPRSCQQLAVSQRLSQLLPPVSACSSLRVPHLLSASPAPRPPGDANAQLLWRTADLAPSASSRAAGYALVALTQPASCGSLPGSTSMGCSPMQLSSSPWTSNLLRQGDAVI